MRKEKDTGKTIKQKSRRAKIKKSEAKTIKTKRSDTKPQVELKKIGKKESEVLRDKKIKEIKKKLLARKETLLAEAEEALNELPGQTIFPDLGDQATAETERNFMLRLRGRERRLLKKIDDAIERIESGTFGICEKCGMEIDIRRLEARPVTTLCIECKTQQEEEEKLMEK